MLEKSTAKLLPAEMTLILCSKLSVGRNLQVTVFLNNAMWNVQCTCKQQSFQFFDSVNAHPLSKSFVGHAAACFNTQSIMHVSNIIELPWLPDH